MASFPNIFISEDSVSSQFIQQIKSVELEVVIAAGLKLFQVKTNYTAEYDLMLFITQYKCFKEPLMNNISHKSDTFQGSFKGKILVFPFVFREHLIF